MKTIAINTDNAEGYLYRARRTILALDEGERIVARSRAQSLLEGLFSLTDDEIPLSEDEKEDLAAFELLAADGRITQHLLGRIRTAILNISIARVFSGKALAAKEAAA